jgi:hypothetical protein
VAKRHLPIRRLRQSAVAIEGHANERKTRARSECRVRFFNNEAARGSPAK